MGKLDDLGDTVNRFGKKVPGGAEAAAVSTEQRSRVKLI